MGAHAFFVLGTVPIMSKPAPLDPAQFLQNFASYIRAPLSVPPTMHIVNSINSIRLHSPSDPCPTDLDGILTEGQDPGAQQYLVLGTVPIKGKNLGFWVPMHF